MNRFVELPADPAVLRGDLHVPDDAKGIVVISGSDGKRGGNSEKQRISRRFQAERLATLLIDLLTPREVRLDGGPVNHRVDVRFLANQLISVVDWVLGQTDINHLRLGYFGTDAAGAAGLVAAAERPNAVRAVVSCGGRPDLAGLALPEVKAPTLLIVGRDYLPTLALSRQVLLHFRTESRLEIVPGAGARFEEPAKLEQVADLASEWFLKYLVAPDEKY